MASFNTKSIFRSYAIAYPEVSTMRLLIGIMLLLLIIGIAASTQSGNSTGKGIILSSIAKNITNQTNTSINQTNITKQMNSTNQTNISVITKSVLAGNGVNRSAMATLSKPTFKTSPVSSPGNEAAPLGEGMAMETPSRASFDSSVI
jgi:hypothetical protein